MPDFPLRDASILCLSCEDWWYHPPRSRRRFMEVFARFNRVLFVNSIGMRRPALRHPDFRRRLGRKLRSYSRLVRRVQPSLHVMSPVALPFYGSGVVRRLNTLLLQAQIGAVRRALRMSHPILWIALPTYADLMGRFGARLNVFQASDKYDAYQEVRHASVSQAFNRLARESDVVLVSSHRLHQLVSPLNAATYHVPHGVDFDLFARARDPQLPLPHDLRAIPPPRLGYVGGLDQVIDNDLLRAIAQRRPNWHIVLIGPPSGEIAELFSLPNIHWLGARDYHLVPAYLKGFDVCLIPKKRNEWFAYSSPIKMKEYLAAGRQVVTMHYDDVADCAPWVWVAQDREEFVTALEAILERGERKDVTAAEPWLRACSWETQAALVAQIIHNHLGQQQPARP